VRVDGEITIGLDVIDVDDVALLHDELQLNPTAVESASLVAQQYHERWLRELMAMDGDALSEFAAHHGANVQSLSALRRKLVAHFRPLPFLRQERDTRALDLLIKELELGKTVVLEFGQHRRLLPYMLVANIITRRIHGLWVAKMERYLQTKDAAHRPQPLMITIEEAHRFLNGDAARQTSFGTIAREMRKFNVTLLVVDQRPSGIDSEVLSQIGTRITAQLSDDRDIDAIFTGVAGASKLRQMLATLDSREQAMILGHAVPMPLVFRVRRYDENLYAALAPFDAQRRFARAEPDLSNSADTNGKVIDITSARQQAREGAARAYEDLFPE